MSRYTLESNESDEFQPGSEQRVLRNLLGITSPAEMEKREAWALADAMSKSYAETDLETQFNVLTLRAMHRRWLGEIYDFAGEIRTVNVSKGGVMFAPVIHLEQTLAELDRVLLQHTPCRGFSRSELARALTIVHAELVLAHPFREGNGRLARWLADLMALQAGSPPLHWGFDIEPEKHRDRYFAALRRAFMKDWDPLEALISSALDGESDHFR